MSKQKYYTISWKIVMKISQLGVACQRTDDLGSGYRDDIICWETITKGTRAIEATLGTPMM